MGFRREGTREETEGIRERYKRALRQRAAEESEKARAKFWTKIDAAINEANSCESGANKDAEEILREWESTAMELQGRIDSLLG